MLFFCGKNKLSLTGNFSFFDGSDLSSCSTSLEYMRELTVFLPKLVGLFFSSMCKVHKAISIEENRGGLGEGCMAR